MGNPDVNLWVVRVTRSIVRFPGPRNLACYMGDKGRCLSQTDEAVTVDFR